MMVIEFTLVVLLGAVLAGFLGALTGLGGGVVIIPLLTLVFGIDIRYAIGASLIAVITTSSGAAAAFVKEGFTNIRIGMFLEIATTLGAIGGAFLSGFVSPSIIAIIFGMVLIGSSALSLRGHRDFPVGSSVADPLAVRLKLDGNYPAGGELRSYHVRSVPAGFSIMAIAGALSGLLGIGSGALKVLAMDQVMRIPFKVSTTTSNFMIGVTAAASAGIYLHRGYIDPVIAMPVMLGVLAGAMVGAKVLVRADTKKLRLVFAIVVFVLALEMIVQGVEGRM